MADKTEKIKELAKKKSDERQDDVLKVIRKMQKDVQKVTFYGVAKATGASKSYLYNNTAISEVIRNAREENPEPRSEKSKQSIISAQRLGIRRLQKQIEDLKSTNGETYKDKCEKLAQENADLRKQLENAYTAW